MIFLGLLLRGLLRLFTRLFFLALVLLSLLKVISFGLALYAEHHPKEVERLASKLFGMPVQVESIQTSWRGFTPRIWLRGLSVGAADDRMQLGDVLATVSLRALAHWPETLPLTLHLTHTRIQVVRETDGTTRIAGLSQRENEVALPSLLVIYDAVVTWEDHKRRTRLVESGIDLQLQSRGPRRQLLLRARQGRLLLRGEIQGRLSGTHWSARFWIRGDQVDLASALRPYLPEELALQSARADFQAWSRWSQGIHRETRLRLQLPKTRLSHGEGKPLELHDLVLDLAYRAGIPDWKLQLSNLSFQLDKAPPHPATAAAMQGNEAGLGLAVTKLDVAAVTPLVRLLSPEPAQQHVLAAISPQGQLQDLRATIHRQPAGDRWRARGKLHDLHLTPWKKLPGVRQLQAEFVASPGRVELHIESEDTTVELPRLFRRPIELGFLEGTLVWRKTGLNGWQLESHRLVAENDDIATVTRLHLSRNGQDPLFADIQTDFRNGDGTQAPAYYPVGIMKPKLVQWLDRAILFGRVPKGSFLLYGPLNHFPFHHQHDGHFEVLFQAEDLTLDYHPDWPPLTEGIAEVRFLGNQLDIQVRSSKLYDSRIQQARARIPSLKPLAPLEISGTMEGPLEDELRLLRETPLRARLARHVEGIHLEGEGRLQAKLRIPFQGHDYRFEGSLVFDNARFLWAPQKLTIDHLSGDLLIDNQGLQGKGIRGRLFGKPVTLQVSPQETFTRISAQGSITSTAMLTQFPLLRALRPEGETRFRMELELPTNRSGGRDQVQLRLFSNLQGLSLGLPPPLNKDQRGRLETAFNLEISQQERKLILKLGEALGLTAHLTSDDRLRLSLALSHLPLRAWTRWFQSGAVSAQGSSYRVDRILLRTEQLQASPLVARDLELELTQEGNAWKGRVTSDAIRGRLSLNPGKGRKILDLELETLHLTTAGAYSKASDGDSPELPPDPRAMPLLRLHARSFRLNQANLGELALRTTAHSRGQRIDTFAFTGGLARMHASGGWLQDADDQHTQLTGTFNTDDMGAFLKQALQMDFLAGSKAYLSFDLEWPGAPYQFDLASLDGHLQLDMTAGQFLNIKPGAARILGLLNVRTLGRRLKFDFKDLYAQGLAFDTILGRFQLEDGVLYTNDLEISAPTSTIRIAGSTNLSNHTHDQLITVSPKLDATLPVAGAVVGGPVAGLVVLLAQQAFSNELEKAQRLHYTVTGSWDDPVVAPMKKREKKAPESPREEPPMQ